MIAIDITLREMLAH